MERERVHRLVLGVTAITASLVLAFHFGMTALYNVPLNPVKQKFDGLNRAYMDPYFSQDWHLFAPDPIVENQGVLVRAEVRVGGGSERLTKWLDITTPDYLILYGQHFWPSRMARVSAGALQQVEQWRDPTLQKTPKNPPPTKEELAKRAEALRLMQAVASAAAKRRWGATVTRVQVRIVHNEFPRFSRRSVRDVKGKVTYYDLDWMDAVEVSR